MMRTLIMRLSFLQVSIQMNYDLLKTILGSKENIKTIRRWIAERSHSLGVIIEQIFLYVKQLSTTLQSKPIFTRILQALYVGKRRLRPYSYHHLRVFVCCSK
jgi:hypothetical protein